LKRNNQFPNGDSGFKKIGLKLFAALARIDPRSKAAVAPDPIAVEVAALAIEVPLDNNAVAD
jgi:hypothetical protein